MDRKSQGFIISVQCFPLTVPSPSVEKDPFPQLTIGVTEATH